MSHTDRLPNVGSWERDKLLKLFWMDAAFRTSGCMWLTSCQIRLPLIFRILLRELVISILLVLLDSGSMNGAVLLVMPSFTL